MNRKKSVNIRVFDVCNVLLLTVLALAALYPLVFVFSASISDPKSVVMGEVVLLPKKITLIAYRMVFELKTIWTAYGNTLFYSVFGVALSMIVTIGAAYALSKKRLMGRKLITLFIIFTMWFNAGMIPTYMNYRNLGLYNTRAGILLFAAASAYYMIILRTFFETIPVSLEESAKLDGANDFCILTKISLPLSKPALFTVGFYFLVERWNGYFWSMLLLKDEGKLPLQVILKKLLLDVVNSSEMMDTSQVYSDATVIYATIMVAIVPILIVYPVIFKYFKAGALVGAVKE